MDKLNGSDMHDHLTKIVNKNNTQSAFGTCWNETMIDLDTITEDGDIIKLKLFVLEQSVTKYSDLNEKEKGYADSRLAWLNEQNNK